MLILIANVCIPDISIQPRGQFSPSGGVDFSEVVCGRQKVIHPIKKSCTSSYNMVQS